MAVRRRHVGARGYLQFEAADLAAMAGLLHVADFHLSDPDDFRRGWRVDFVAVRCRLPGMHSRTKGWVPLPVSTAWQPQRTAPQAGARYHFLTQPTVAAAFGTPNQRLTDDG